MPVRAGVDRVQPVRGAHKGADVGVQVAQDLVDVVQGVRAYLGAPAVVAVGGEVHEGELFHHGLAHPHWIGQWYRAGEVRGDPDRGHLRVERTEERRVVSVEVQALYIERQDLPVQHEVGPLV